MEDAAGEQFPSQASLPVLYRPYYPGLFAFMLSATASERAAELLSTRIMTTAWQERGSLDAHGRKIALFRAARQAVRSMPWRETEPLRGMSERQTSADELQAAVQFLPPLEREAIWLTFDAALCCKEIGEILSLTEHEAAFLIVRALRRLKGELRTA